MSLSGDFILKDLGQSGPKVGGRDNNLRSNGVGIMPPVISGISNVITASSNLLIDERISSIVRMLVDLRMRMIL